MTFCKITNFLLCIIFLTVSNGSLCQKQNNQWHFGNNGAINFNVTPPAFVTGSAIATSEGSASIADKNTGALLFYTDGVTVWNASNQVMPNGTGLLGGTQLLLSSTTAAVIVPKPNANNLFYFITIDEQSSNSGVRYSVVDMTLNGGLGDVVAGQKNIFLYQTNSEKLEVVPASDGLSYWLITHDNSNAFVSFKIDNSGIQTTPITSSVGGNQGNGAGHLKVNRQFNKIALGNFFSADIELFDFNNTTGILSNPKIWNFNYPNSLIYGVEFSPNGNLLYVTNIEKLIQYDISKTTTLAIENSAFEVSSGIYQAASLQLAIDDKIYINAGTIDAINCPNKLGIACGFQKNVIANQTGGGGYGLPKWVYYATDTSLFALNKIIYSDSCLGNVTQFSIKNNANVSSVNWLFGDPNSGVNNTAIGFNVNHTFSQIGNFTVRAILTNNCGFDTLFLNQLQILNCTNPPTSITGIKLAGDTCNVTAGISFQAVGTSSSPYFFWNFDDPLSGSNDTITITGLSTPPFPTHTFSAPGIYNVCVSFREPGSAVTTVCRTIYIGLCCDAILNSNDSCLQNSIPFSLNSGTIINAINWNFGDPLSGANNTSTSTNPTHIFSSAGTYTITAIINANCSTYTKTFTKRIVSCLPPIPCTGLILSSDTCLQNAINFQVASSSTINSIQWNFGDAASGANNISFANLPSHTFSGTSTFNVTAITNFSCGTDTLRKTINVVSCNPSSHPTNCELNMPNAFSPNGDGVNDFIFPVNIQNCIFNDYEFLIFNRWGQLVFHTKNISQKWDGKYNNKNCPDGTFYYVLSYKFHNLIKANTKSGFIQLLR